MITYSADTWHATEVRADGAYAVSFTAPSLAAAQAHCDERGWTLEGSGGFECSEEEMAAYSPSGDHIAGANALLALLTERDEARAH